MTDTDEKPYIVIDPNKDIHGNVLGRERYLRLEYWKPLNAYIEIFVQSSDDATLFDFWDAKARVRISRMGGLISTLESRNTRSIDD